jgi:hypothetical protein
MLAEGMRLAKEDVALVPLYAQSVTVATRTGLGYRTWLHEYTMANSVRVVGH